MLVPQAFELRAIHEARPVLPRRRPASASSIAPLSSTGTTPSNVPEDAKRQNRFAKKDWPDEFSLDRLFNAS